MSVERRHLRDLSEAPVKRGIRLVGLSFLQRAEEAFARLSVNSDADALHDFRVSLRRLRSHLTSYREWLRESVDRKDERRLRAVARASNPCRDFEVLLGLLKQLEPEGELERKGLVLLEQRFRTLLEEAIRSFRAEALHDFPALARELQRGLNQQLEPLNLDGSPRDRFGQVAARLAAPLRQEVRSELSGVRSIEHQTEAHDARIAGKKLRYLLEPFAPQNAACAAAVAGLKAFQDELGELHDVHVLMTETEVALNTPDLDQQASLAATLEHIRTLRSQRFAEVEREYLTSRAALLLEKVRAAETELARARHGREIERKFLLRRMPRLRDAREWLIEQGYLPGTEIRERVRSIKRDDGRSYFRTLKAGHGLSRLEIEEETSEEIFKKLYALTRGRRIRKRRYIVEANGLRWEIDRFLDRKLVIAEVELEFEDQPLDFPAWLRGLVEREVTNDAAFANESLAC